MRVCDENIQKTIFRTPYGHKWVCGDAFQIHQRTGNVHGSHEPDVQAIVGSIGNDVHQRYLGVLEIQRAARGVSYRDSWTIEDGEAVCQILQV